MNDESGPSSATAAVFSIAAQVHVSHHPGLLRPLRILLVRDGGILRVGRSTQLKLCLLCRHRFSVVSSIASDFPFPIEPLVNTSTEPFGNAPANRPPLPFPTSLGAVTEVIFIATGCHRRRHHWPGHLHIHHRSVRPLAYTCLPSFEMHSAPIASAVALRAIRLPVVASHSDKSPSAPSPLRNPVVAKYFRRA